jgi:hypothetical protein
MLKYETTANHPTIAPPAPGIPANKTHPKNANPPADPRDLADSTHKKSACPDRRRPIPPHLPPYGRGQRTDRQSPPTAGDQHRIPHTPADGPLRPSFRYTTRLGRTGRYDGRSAGSPIKYLRLHSESRPDGKIRTSHPPRPAAPGPGAGLFISAKLQSDSSLLPATPTNSTNFHLPAYLMLFETYLK